MLLGGLPFTFNSKTNPQLWEVGEYVSADLKHNALLCLSLGCFCCSLHFSETFLTAFFEDCLWIPLLDVTGANSIPDFKLTSSKGQLLTNMLKLTFAFCIGALLLIIESFNNFVSSASDFAWTELIIATFFFFQKICLLILQKERKGEREKHWCERENISWLPLL